MTEEIQTLTVNEAIKEYYNLKSRYETLHHDKYIKPILKSNKSKKEKRVEFSRLPKNECINCKRNVGTIFNIYQDPKQSLRFFIGKCGDLSDPCPLDIQIQTSYREQYSKAINDELRKIEEIKIKVIKEKNNALFFNKKVLDTFESLSQELKGLTQIAGFLIESNILKNNNPEKIDMLNKSVDDFGKSFVLPFKQMIKDYMEKGDELKLNSAIQFYLNEMKPKLKEIQEFKYDINSVIYDEEYTGGNIIGGAFRLIQYPNSLQNTEFTVESDDKVISFVKGLKKIKKTTTLKDVKMKKNTTRKIKPKGKLIIEEEAEVEEVPDEKEEIQLTPKEPNLEGVPEFDGPSDVKWDNKLYDDIWRSVPTTLKDILMEDKEWLQEYMSNCVEARQTGKRCALILPSRTVLPPKITVDDSYEPAMEIYDFDVKILNKIFNNLNKSYKERLLTMYTEKDGKKNYSMLKNTLTDILEKQIMPGGVSGYY